MNRFHTPLDDRENEVLRETLESMKSWALVSGLGKPEPPADGRTSTKRIVWSTRIWSKQYTIADDLVMAAESGILEELSRKATGKPIGTRGSELDLETFVLLAETRHLELDDPDLFLVLPPYIAKGKRDRIEPLREAGVGIGCSNRLPAPAGGNAQQAIGIALRKKRSFFLRANLENTVVSLDEARIRHGPWIYAPADELPCGIEVRRVPGNEEELEKKLNRDGDFPDFAFIIDWGMTVLEPDSVSLVYFV